MPSSRERPIVAAALTMATILAVSTASPGLGSAAADELELARDLASQGDWDGVIDAYTRALDGNDGLVAALSGRCNALRVIGELDRALADCDRAIELDPNAAAYVSRGNLHDDRGDLDRALADYDRAIELDPGAAGAYRNRGVARHRAGDTELALADYDRAIALAPAYAKAYASRGALRLVIGDRAGAATDIERALELDPDDAEAHLIRGRLYRVGDDAGAAIEHYDRSISLDPRDPLAYAERALALIDIDAFAAAIDDADRAISLRPDEAAGYHSRGLARAHLGQDDRAITDYDRAIALAPDYGDAIFARTRAHLRQGDAAAALADSERLVALHPDLSMFLAFRAYARAMGRDWDGAVVDFERSLAMAADPSERFAIQELRDSLPALEPQPVDDAAGRFSITLPPGWDYALADDVDPSDWYDTTAPGDAVTLHEDRLEAGLLLEARESFDLEPSTEWCELFDITDYAKEPPAWETLAAAEDTYRWSMPNERGNISVESAYLVRPDGEILVIDSRWDDGRDVRDHLYLDDDRWLQLTCAAVDGAPDDRWRSIAETVVSVPQEADEPQPFTTMGIDDARRR